MRGLGMTPTQLKDSIDSSSNTINEDKLVPLSSRNRDSVFTKEFVARLMVGKYRNRHKKVPMIKDAVSQHLYCKLIEIVKPATIIDLGTAFGGSSLWFKDQYPSAKVVTIDIEDFRNDISKVDNIDFLKLDLHQSESVIKALSNYEHPWIVCEDCHVEASSIMKVFKNIMKKNDYIVFEDTHPFNPEETGMSAESEKYECGTWSTNKLEKVETEMKKHPEFLIDTEIQDFYGYNGSTFINSVFIKT